MNRVRSPEFGPLARNSGFWGVGMSYAIACVLAVVCGGLIWL